MLELRTGIMEKELFLFLKGGWLRFERNGREKLKISSFCLVLLHAPNDVFCFNPVFSILNQFSIIPLYIYYSPNMEKNNYWNYCRSMSYGYIFRHNMHDVCVADVTPLLSVCR